jgi:uncharacterized protein
MSRTPRESQLKAEVEIVEGIGKLSRETWNSVLDPADSPFLDWDFLHAMEESGCATRDTGWAPYHLIVRDKAGQLAGACPLYLKTHSMGEFVFDHGWADAAERAGIRYYPKLLVGVPFTPHTGRRFLTAPGADRGATMSILAQALIGLCVENKLSSIHVNFCAPDEAVALSAIGFVERLGYQYHWRNAGFHNFNDYLNNLKSKRRSAVRHERAELEKQGVTIRVYAGDEIPDSMFPPMFQLYRSTIDKLYWGRQYLTAKFFDLMRTRFKRHLCLVGAFQGEELVAGTFNLQKAGVVYGRYWGCFRDLKYLHFNVCYYAAIEHCIANGLTRFEPGAGGEYKWLRGFDPALTRSAHFIVHPGLRKAIANSVAHERREVEAWIAMGREHSQLKAPPPSDAEQA